MNSETWQTLPVLKANYVRLLDPDGDVEDIYRGHLEGTLECSDEPLRMFYSQKQWLAFVAEQKAIADNWNSRSTFTDHDRAWLAEMAVGWNVEPKSPVGKTNPNHFRLTVPELVWLKQIGICVPQSDWKTLNPREARSNIEKNWHRSDQFWFHDLIKAFGTPEEQARIKGLNVGYPPSS